MTVHAFVDESARPPQYLIAVAIVEPSRVRLLRQSMRGLLMQGQRELHFKKESRFADEPARQECMARLVQDLLARQAQRLVIDTRQVRDAHDERTLRKALGPLPSAGQRKRPDPV